MIKAWSLLFLTVPKVPFSVSNLLEYVVEEVETRDSEDDIDNSAPAYHHYCLVLKTTKQPNSTYLLVESKEEKVKLFLLLFSSLHSCRSCEKAENSISDAKFGSGYHIGQVQKKRLGKGENHGGGGAKIEFSAFLQDRQLRRLIVFSPECVCVYPLLKC